MQKNLKWLNVVLGAALILVTAASLGGYWYIRQQDINSLQQQIDKVQDAKDKAALVKDRITLENAIAGTLIQGFGGLFFVVTAFFSWQNMKSTQRSVSVAEDNLKETRRSILISEEKQVTERFTQAINQLGSDEITVRVGGIYALERIAKDSDKDHWTIIEVLSSFIREPVQLKPEQLAKSSTKIRKDVQAALTVIGSRTVKYDPPDKRIDLSGANLANANLSKAVLKSANLSEAVLESANLSDAQLDDADLSCANFYGADLRKAKMHRVNLTHANFSCADLTNAELIEAKILLPQLRMHNAVLCEANLTGVDLVGADLSCAVLTDAILRGAILRKAKFSKEGLGEYHRDPTLEGADLTEAKLETADLRGVCLRGAKLEGAVLRGARLNCTILDDISSSHQVLQQIQTTNGWREAYYSLELVQKLGLPPEQRS